MIVNFALLGCGKIAAKHARVIQESLPDCRLVAVCDTVRERAVSFAEEKGVLGYESAESMLRNCPERIDAVIVTTPSGLHYENVMELAELDCPNIIVEKPIALNLEEGEKMVQVCKARDIRLFVVKQNRYNIPVRALKEKIEDGSVGKLVLGAVRVRWCRDQKYYDQAYWRGTMEMDGGVLANQAIHHIDLLVWLMGPVRSVTAYGATRLMNIEAEDTAVATLAFENGAVATVEATTATRPRDLEASISILGEKAAVEIGGFSANELKLWEFADSENSRREVFDQHRENPKDIFAYGHKMYLEDAAERIRKKEPATIDGNAGMHSLKVISAMYESIESGEPVLLENYAPNKCRLGRRIPKPASLLSN